MPRVLAFGDVHGCYHPLMHILQKAGILDRRGHWVARDTELVGLGDYIDRGPAVAQVLDLLARLGAEAAQQNSRVVCLRGNHEQVMLDAARGDPNDLFFWQELGGEATVESYGTSMAAFAAAPHRVIPENHWTFLNSLPLTHRTADTLFVHAGVELGRPFDQQDPYTLMEIRRWWNGPPNGIERQFGVKRIVFGHTPHREVTAYLEGRAIAIDTGAVYGGKLSLIEVANDTWHLVAQA